MKKLLTFVTLAILSVNSFAAIDGIPLKDDQYAHIFGSAYITEVCKSADLEWWQTGLILLGAGVAKEIYDMKSTGFNWGDIGLNFAGLGLSYSVDFVLDI